MSRLQDLLGLVRGIQSVAQEGIKVQGAQLKVIWDNSSIRTGAQEVTKRVKKSANSSAENPTEVAKMVSETADKFATVVKGMQEYVVHTQSAFIVGGNKGQC